MSIVEDTERTQFCPQTERRRDEETDKVKPVYPPFNFVEAGGIMKCANKIEPFDVSLFSISKKLSTNGRVLGRYWSFVRGIHRSPVDSPHKGQWRGASLFSLICAWANSWANNWDVSDLRCDRTHYDVTVMRSMTKQQIDQWN